MKVLLIDDFGKVKLDKLVTKVLIVEENKETGKIHLHGDGYSGIERIGIAELIRTQNIVEICATKESRTTCSIESPKQSLQ